MMMMICLVMTMMMIPFNARFFAPFVFDASINRQAPLIFSSLSLSLSLSISLSDVQEERLC